MLKKNDDGTEILPEMQTFIQNVRSEMAKRKLGVTELARQAGMEQATLSNMINGVHQSNIRTMSQLAESVGVALWKLLRPVARTENPVWKRIDYVVSSRIAPDTPEYAVTFATNLKSIMSAKRIRQVSLAEATGVKQAHISSLLNGGKPNPGGISLRVAARIAEGLGVDLWELFKPRGGESK